MGVSLWNLLLLPEEPLEAADAPAPAKSLSQGGFGMRFFCSLGIPLAKVPSKEWQKVEVFGFLA